MPLDLAADRALHSTASRSSETVLPPAASEYAPHRAYPSSAAARSWHESAPHRPPTTRDPTRSANPPASGSCRWLPCRSAPAPLLAGRIVPRRPRPVPASAPRSPRLRIQPTHLLPTGMKITSYNHHVRRLLSFREALVLKPRLPDSIEPSLLSNQPLRLCFLQRWGAEDSCSAGLPSHLRRFPLKCKTWLASAESIDPKRDRPAESHLSKNERWATRPQNP